MYLTKAEPQECSHYSRYTCSLGILIEKLYPYFTIFVDLIDVIQSSLTPLPVVYVVDTVIDTKAWMLEKIPALHDHLKAHQFKFERNRLGEAQMFYKEWSTDSFWLPTGGLSVLPATDPIPTIQAQVLQPFFLTRIVCQSLRPRSERLVDIWTKQMLPPGGGHGWIVQSSIPRMWRLEH